eukprot:TRINITY_DN4148_c0_g1_i1.p1 TRINITY_DN4148_c0_g1~~TRINITY_DN4148_c0_g1_i1.p1  ORF type:complete len:119 (-),score=7.28 TRINITY_DN4148_c0_g1_i1:40-396(-)
MPTFRAKPLPYKKFKSFQDFYPYYLGEHMNPTCRLLHFIGTLGSNIMLLLSLIIGEFKYFLFAPLIGYSFAWVGHFIFERNKPATFKHPIYSLMGDYVMFYDLCVGNRPFDENKLEKK